MRADNNSIHKMRSYLPKPCMRCTCKMTHMHSHTYTYKYAAPKPQCLRTWPPATCPTGCWQTFHVHRLRWMLTRTCFPPVSVRMRTHIIIICLVYTRMDKLHIHPDRYESRVELSIVCDTICSLQHTINSVRNLITTFDRATTHHLFIMIHCACICYT